MPKKEKRAVKHKIIAIDARNSIIEGNMVEMPFLYYGKKQDDIKNGIVVEYKWRDSEGRDFELSITGSPKYGLPSPYDLDVFLALLRIKARQSDIAYGKNILSLEDVTEEHTTIDFSLNEITKELGKSSGGSVLHRIRRSINTLLHTTIESNSSGIFYDPVQKEYVELAEGRGYHLVDSCVWQTQKGGGANYDKNKITIGKFFYYSIANSYFKYFDFEMYMSLGKNGVAKRMFLLLNKWRNSKNTQTVKLETLYERIPLDESKTVYKKKEAVVIASKALQKAGFIKSYSIKDQSITFYYPPKTMPKKQTENLLSRYNLFTEIQARLISYGITELEIMSMHINSIVAHLPYVKAFLRYADDHLANEQSKDAKAFIENGLHAHLKIDKKYYNEQDR